MLTPDSPFLSDVVTPAFARRHGAVASPVPPTFQHLPIMSSRSPSSVPAASVIHSPSPADAFLARLSALYGFTQRSSHVFASPLGPFFLQARSLNLPRFVFFGPHASEESWRIAFLAGFDHRDLRASTALLGLVEHLGNRAEDGHGLNLSFFPVVDAAGLFVHHAPRPLAAAHWGKSSAPEIALLEKDARLTGYHGFVRVETAPAGEEIISVIVRAPGGLAAAPDVELISSEETEPFPVRFERAVSPTTSAAGPLSVAEDFAVNPFELTLRIPATWPDEIHHEAVQSILSRFILRYRAFQAYGQHL